MRRKLFRGDRCTFPHSHLIYTASVRIFVAELRIKLMSTVATHISVEPGSEAFPLLTPAQIERLRPHGKLRHVEAGEVLFEPGDSNVPVYVVLSGGLEILQPVPRVRDPWSGTFPAASPASLPSSQASARCCADRSSPPANFCRSRLASSAPSSPKMQSWAIS